MVFFCFCIFVVYAKHGLMIKINFTLAGNERVKRECLILPTCNRTRIGEILVQPKEA